MIKYLNLFTVFSLKKLYPPTTCSASLIIKPILEICFDNFYLEFSSRKVIFPRNSPASYFLLFLKIMEKKEYSGMEMELFRAHTAQIVQF